MIPPEYHRERKMISLVWQTGERSSLSVGAIRSGESVRRHRRATTRSSKFARRHSELADAVFEVIFMMTGSRSPVMETAICITVALEKPSRAKVGMLWRYEANTSIADSGWQTIHDLQVV